MLPSVCRGDFVAAVRICAGAWRRRVLFVSAGTVGTGSRLGLASRAHGTLGKRP
jgi:hypothetical protein